MAVGGRREEGRAGGMRVGECGCRMAAKPGGWPAVFVGRQAEGAVREESSSERHSELQRRRRRRLRALHPSILPSLFPPSLIPPSIPPSSSRSPCAAPPEPPLPPPSGAFSLCPPPPPLPPAPPAPPPLHPPSPLPLLPRPHGGAARGEPEAGGPASLLPDKALSRFADAAFVHWGGWALPEPPPPHTHIHTHLFSRIREKRERCCPRRRSPEKQVWGRGCRTGRRWFVPKAGGGRDGDKGGRRGGPAGGVQPSLPPPCLHCSPKDEDRHPPPSFHQAAADRWSLYLILFRGGGGTGKEKK